LERTAQVAGRRVKAILTDQRAWSTATWPAFVLQGIISIYIILIMWDLKIFFLQNTNAPI
jgi:hypothetical protein